MNIKYLQGTNYNIHDYYNYVEDLLAMIGKSTKKIYQIGQKVRIRVENASKATANIDFVLVEDKDGSSKQES